MAEGLAGRLTVLPPDTGCYVPIARGFSVRDAVLLCRGLRGDGVCKEPSFVKRKGCAW